LIEKALTAMDDAYGDFLMRRISRDKFEKTMSNILSAMPFDSGKKHFEVSIINENKKQPFFGFYIYPVLNDMTIFTQNIIAEDVVSFKELCDRWKSIKNWYIEIDANCFDRNTFGFSPKELTAMTVHEIGHTIYSDKPVERWYRSYMDAKSRMQMADRASSKILYALYCVPLAVSCMQKNWVTPKNQLKIEYAADREALKYGYGEPLVTALNKIIKASGSINDTEAVADQNVDASMKWCNVNVTDLTHRREKLKDELFYQGLKTQSNYVKAMGIWILDHLGARMRERYTGYAVEMTIEMFDDKNFVDHYKISMDSAAMGKLERLIDIAKQSAQMEIATEAFGKKKTPKLPSQYDIDAISIEIDKIENHYDRTYVLDLIYKTLDDITIFEEWINATDPTKAKQYTSTINRYRKELDELRKACLAKKNLEREYRLFVKYPAGYEG